jgi:hypothetical protein
MRQRRISDRKSEATRGRQRQISGHEMPITNCGSQINRRESALCLFSSGKLGIVGSAMGTLSGF